MHKGQLVHKSLCASGGGGLAPSAQMLPIWKCKSPFGIALLLRALDPMPPGYFRPIIFLRYARLPPPSAAADARELRSQSQRKSSSWLGVALAGSGGRAAQLMPRRSPRKFVAR